MRKKNPDVSQSLARAGGSTPVPVRHAAASFPVVGIGASAGGLEAFTELLKHLPLDTGMGFVLVQHLDPEHESALTQILSRATSLSVHEVANNQRVEPNNIYVIPPDTNMRIDAGVLILQPRPKTRTPHRPIDTFFESLAQDQREAAIGVVLSGTASDGTLGLEAIKAEGGITFVQDASARYDSMPRSAIAAGCVDLVLSPAQIAQELGRIAQHPYGAGQPLELSMRAEMDRAEATAHEDDQTSLPSGGSGTPRTGGRTARSEVRRAQKSGSKSASQAQEGYKKVLLLLRNHSGVDFSLYKSTTIQRRVARRLVLNKQDTLEEYAGFLRGNDKELDALYSDVLISVTSFFRNPEAFEILQRNVLPKLLKQRSEEPLRCWVLGCSTGQEAYSIAMAFVEVAEKSARARKLQIFATDLNEVLLNKARHGLYAKSLATDLSPQRLRRFFVEEEGGYRISKALREMVVFARQNLIADPPFSRLDLISCRNLLIYLEPGLQKKALPTFHYALKPTGFLLLGDSESIGGFTELFEPVDKKFKIYSKKIAPSPTFHLPVKRERAPLLTDRPALPMRSIIAPMPPEDLRGELNAQREADRITINHFAPPGVLVNAELQVVQFRGPTGTYLQPAAGKASFDVLKMAREGLMLPLRSAINQVKKSNKTVRKDNVRIKRNGEIRAVNLEIIPLKNVRERGFLILFEEAKNTASVSSRKRLEPINPVTPTRRESKRIAELEAELAEMREYLQSMQEQHEASNEELQAANEEVQSANEELQSINEELETSKEELESANEELITVNEEMVNRNLELHQLNNDLVNLQSSSRLSLVLLGRDLTLRRFSPQAEKQFELLATDVGRPINHIRHHLVLVASSGEESALDLEALSAEVVATVREQEREVRDKSGRWYSLRVRPYMTLDNKVDGAVLVLVDIDTLKRSEQTIAAARDYAESVIGTVREPLLVLDKNLHVESANRAFYRAFQVKPAETIGRFVYDLGNRQWDIPRLRELLDDILKHSTRIDAFQVEYNFEQLGRRTMLLNAQRLHNSERRTEQILLAIEDITDRLHAQEAMRESEERHRTLFNSIDEGFCVVEILFDPDGIPNDYRFLEVNPAFEKQSGLHAVAGKRMRELAPEHEARWFEIYGKVVATGEPVRFIEEARALGGRWFDVYAFRLGGTDSRRVAVLFTDITERRKSEETIRHSDEQLRQHAASLVETDRHKNEFLAMLAHELRNPLAPISNSLRILRLASGNGPTVDAVIDILERQVQHMVRLVDDLLDVNRISQGKIELRRERVELAPIIADAVQIARPLMDRMGHELIITLPPEPIYLNADPSRIAQVVGNLLNNAAKFTEKNGRIKLTVERTEEQAVIRVQDNGIGIATDQLPLIFDMFMQANVSLERSVSGLGIGLTLVRKLVEMHDGTVEAHSEGVDHGSEFVVRLPAVADAPKTMKPRPSVNAREANSTQCVLVVDDNHDSADSLAMLLRMNGTQTYIAHDGIEAIEAAARLRPDLVLLDIGMPKLNGYEVARRIRAQPWGKHMVLIALTGWGQEEHRQKSREAGLDGHLVKPVDPDALAALMVNFQSSAAHSSW